MATPDFPQLPHISKFRLIYLNQQIQVIHRELHRPNSMLNRRFLHSTSTSFEANVAQQISISSNLVKNIALWESTQSPSMNSNT